MHIITYQVFMYIYMILLYDYKLYIYIYCIIIHIYDNYFVFEVLFYWVYWWLWMNKKWTPAPGQQRGNYLQTSGSVKYNVVSRSIRHAHSVTHMAENDTNSFNPFNQMQWTYNEQAKQLKAKTPSVFYRKGPPSYKLVYNS